MVLSGASYLLLACAIFSMTNLATNCFYCDSHGMVFVMYVLSDICIMVNRQNGHDPVAFYDDTLYDSIASCKVRSTGHIACDVKYLTPGYGD